MHPRNRYLTRPPDFKELSIKHEPLKSYLVETGKLNPKEPGAIAELVSALLKVDFNIDSWEGIPHGYLIPSVTRSLNYLHFIEDLLQDMKEEKDTEKRLKQIVRGIDVGVGSSCIFPLLGCSLNDNWNFVGIDIDDLAIDFARRNSKQFENRIEIRKAISDNVPHIIETLNEDETFDFLMCNPPFFDSPQTDAPFRPFAGTDLERFCKGGEVGFISGLIDESILLKHRVTWFSSMIGMKESMKAILGKLNFQAQAETIRTYRLEQGNKFRWVIAWSFSPALRSGILGEEITIRNLRKDETIDIRFKEAINELHNFDVHTGICGGDDYRFRVRVIMLEENKARVDVLDLKGDDVEHRAKSVQQKVEQDLLRTNRKWKKKLQNKRRTSPS